jgi:hypothetical protein
MAEAQESNDVLVAEVAEEDTLSQNRLLLNRILSKMEMMEKKLDVVDLRVMKLELKTNTGFEGLLGMHQQHCRMLGDLGFKAVLHAGLFSVLAQALKVPKDTWDEHVAELDRALKERFNGESTEEEEEEEEAV